MVEIWCMYRMDIWDRIAAHRADIAEGAPKDHRRNNKLERGDALWECVNV